MLLERIFSIFTSLRLTVFCLACALVLVFAGTLAQVHLGLYVTQERYFHSIFVMWNVPGTAWRIPVWPGGYLIGAVLLLNLLAAYSKRLSFAPKKIGLFMTHGGLVLLFVGQFLTETFQVESFMRLEEGETKNYTESNRRNELAVIDISNPATDQVVAIPESRLAEKTELGHPSLPFTIRVKEYFQNSRPAPARADVAGDMKRIEASQGVGQRLRFQPSAPTSAMDDENVPTALIEIVTSKGSLGTWTVSNWLTKYPGNLIKALGSQGASLVQTPQELTVENKTYRLSLRPVRYYLDHSITLLDFTHKRYKGTDIPKDFSSRVRVRNAKSGEDREVLIYMNNPLRYAGLTYYQGGFEPGDTVSILQVVRNPAWLTPYLSCTLVGLGLTIHFLIHLVQFGKRRRQSPPPSADSRSRKRPAVRKPSKTPEPALARTALARALPFAGKRRTT